MGALQDLLRGIGKIIGKGGKQADADANKSIDPLLKRVFMFLEDGDYKSADEYSNRVLDIDPENEKAYLGKLLAQHQVHEISQLSSLNKPIENDVSYKKILKYGSRQLADELLDINSTIKKNNSKKVDS